MLSLIHPIGLKLAAAHCCCVDMAMSHQLIIGNLSRTNTMDHWRLLFPFSRWRGPTNGNLLVFEYSLSSYCTTHRWWEHSNTNCYNLICLNFLPSEVVVTLKTSDPVKLPLPYIFNKQSIDHFKVSNIQFYRSTHQILATKKNI